MTLSPENLAAMNKERRDSMLRAGVPASYADTTLNSLGKTGAETAQWMIDGGGIQEIRGGKTVFVEGPVLPSLDLFFVIGRALHLSGVGIRVIQPLALARIIDGRDYEDIERLEKVPALMLNPFQGTDESPFASSSQRYLVQEFLTTRINAGKAHVLLRRFNPKAWWSNDFLELAARNSRTLMVKS